MLTYDEFIMDVLNWIQSNTTVPVGFEDNEEILSLLVEVYKRLDLLRCYNDDEDEAIVDQSLRSSSICIANLIGNSNKDHDVEIILEILQLYCSLTSKHPTTIVTALEDGVRKRYNGCIVANDDIVDLIVFTILSDYPDIVDDAFQLDNGDLDYDTFYVRLLGVIDTLDRVNH